MIPQVRGFQGCYLDNHRNNWLCARAVPALCPRCAKTPPKGLLPPPALRPPMGGAPASGPCLFPRAASGVLCAVCVWSPQPPSCCECFEVQCQLHNKDLPISVPLGPWLPLGRPQSIPAQTSVGVRLGAQMRSPRRTVAAVTSILAPVF